MADNRSPSLGEGLAGAALMLYAFFTPFLRSRRNRWGVTDAELERAYPGDELIPHPRWQWTHAVTVNSPPPAVWPWVVQMGQGRAGFYSYEFLENLLDSDIHNSDRVVLDWQHLKTGDVIRLHPKMPGIPVVLLEPARALLLHVRTGAFPGERAAFSAPGEEKYFATSWLFFLERTEGDATRLFSRWRIDYSPSLANRISYGPLFLEPIGFTMDRKMLLGIKQRAEASRKTVRQVTG